MIKLKENPIEGKEITMGGDSMIVPSLNLRQVKALTPTIKKMDAEPDPMKKFDYQVKIIREGLGRNYPEITIAEVEELVDMNNVARVAAAVMGLRHIEGIEGLPGGN